MKEREKDVGWLLRQTSGFYHKGLIFGNSLEQLFDIQYTWLVMRMTESLLIYSAI